MAESNLGLTNSELVAYLGLPDDIITDLETAQGSTWVAKSNEFLSALYNKILYQTVASMEFENPFKKFDGFPINYGDTIENVFVELPKGYKFDKDATDPFTKMAPSVKSLYATINYDLQYETTVEDSLLRRACLSEYGFMNLIDTILGALSKSMSVDEYFATLATIANKDIYAAGVEEITEGSTSAETLKTVTEKIVTVGNDFALPKTTNNKLAVMQTSRKDNILLVIKQSLLDKINMGYLSGVYNLSKIDFIPQENIIGVDTFQIKKEDGTLVGEDIDFALLDKRGFDNHVALQDGGLIYNPKGKYTNHFYNLWKIISYKYFYNARAYKIKASE